MASSGEEAAITSSLTDKLRSRAQVLNATLSIVVPMSLKCAVELGIPAAIHSHGGPIPLPDLTAAISLAPARSTHVSRLMRVLQHSGFFAGGEGGYLLTPASQHLMGHGACYAEMILSPPMMAPWPRMSSWFREEEPSVPAPATAFEAVHGMGTYEYAGADPEFNALFNRSMAHDSDLVTAQVVAKCGAAFDGVRTMVDVGGGNGSTARALAANYPHLECTVFDLPHVVEGLPASERVSFVGGDMFDAIPPADVLLFKRVLLGHNDDDCLKVLKRCKQVIPSKMEGGKVIIIDMVLNITDECSKSIETQIFYDILLMTSFGGKGRDEQEWSKIFIEAGFSSHKITHLTDILCLIEVYP